MGESGSSFIIFFLVLLILIFLGLGRIPSSAPRATFRLLVGDSMAEGFDVGVLLNLFVDVLGQLEQVDKNNQNDACHDEFEPVGDEPACIVVLQDLPESLI